MRPDTILPSDACILRGNRVLYFPKSKYAEQVFGTSVGSDYRIGLEHSTILPEPVTGQVPPGYGFKTSYAAASTRSKFLSTTISGLLRFSMAVEMLPALHCSTAIGSMIEKAIVSLCRYANSRRGPVRIGRACVGERVTTDWRVVVETGFLWSEIKVFAMLTLAVKLMIQGRAIKQLKRDGMVAMFQMYGPEGDPRG
jgi:hypothetical protein